MARRGDGLYLRGKTWYLDFRHGGSRPRLCSMSRIDGDRSVAASGLGLDTEPVAMRQLW